MKRVHAFSDDGLGDLDAVGVAAAIAGGELSAAEAADAALARIAAVDPTLRAMAVNDAERARTRARTGEFAGGVFAGVPAVIKNNTALEGLPTRHGSAATPDRPAKADDPFTGQLRETGVNLLGASTLPAFGLTATTEFVDRDPTRNPWNTDYSSGASSGGSAALVAAGAVPIAHGNDGGGSIRIPAAACGLVGLKPTRGRVAADAMAGAAPIDLVSNGVLTRSVRDTAAFFADVERRHPATSLKPIGLVEGPAQRRLRIAVILEPLTGQLLDDDTQAALMATGELLSNLGHRTEMIPMPLERAYVSQFIEYWGLMAFSVDRMGTRVVGKGFRRRDLDPFTRGLSRLYLRRSWRTASSIRGLRKATAAFDGVFERFDVVLSPTVAHTTPKIGYLDPAGDFDEILQRLIHYVAFTPVNNTAGTPAISLPLGQTPDGLPIGMHFSAGRGEEAMLLGLAYELEAARPFARIDA